jgi:hypothetical protein
MAYMPKEGPAPSFLRGLLGAFIGATVGGLIWFTFHYFVGFSLGIFALLPAILSGVMGRKMAREDSGYMGVAAAVLTVIAIFGTRYAITAKEIADEQMGLDGSSLFPPYDERMALAKEATAAKTDDEIRAYLMKQDRQDFEKFAEKGEKYEPTSIDGDRVKFFKEFEQKQFQEFVNGKPSREEYEQQIATAKHAGTWITRIVTAVTVIISVGIFGIFSMIFAVSVAYKQGSGG